MPEIADVVAFMMAAGHTDDRKYFYEHSDAEVRELAMWDEVVECEESNKPKPEWAKKALIAYAKERYESVKFAEQQRILDDYAIWEVVQSNLKHQPNKTKSGKPNVRRACIQHLVDEFVAGKKKWTANEERDIKRIMEAKNVQRKAAIQRYAERRLTPDSIQSVRRAYERACERNEKGFYTRVFSKNALTKGWIASAARSFSHR